MPEARRVVAARNLQEDIANGTNKKNEILFKTHTKYKRGVYKIWEKKNEMITKIEILKMWYNFTKIKINTFWRSIELSMYITQ